jgi:hypothetical protein
MSSGKRAHVAKVKASCEGRGPRFRPNAERTYCYCGALDLGYPHYMAEHTQDHDDAQAMRAKLAEGEAL